MKTKKIIVLLSLLVILFIATLGCTQNNSMANNEGEANEEANALDLPKELVITSGPSGGLWYTQGIATADLLTRDGVKATSVAGGGQANFIAVGDGKADIGFTTTDMFDDAYAGVEPFSRPYDDVVMLMRQDSTFTFIIVPADSNIHSLKDLKGKKIGTPNPGTSSAVTIEKLFTTAGIAGQVNEVPGSISEIIEQLRDRLVDGICTALGSGNAALTELAMSLDLRFIPIEEDVLKEFVALSNGFNEGVIPAGTYPGLTEDTPTMVYDSAVIVNKNMSEDTAYWVVKTMVENWDDLIESCSWLSEVTHEYMAKQEGIALHPGAERYYKELLNKN